VGPERDGDPILLIMAMPMGLTCGIAPPELAASYRVIRFDNRGIGRRLRPAWALPGAS